MFVEVFIMPFVLRMHINAGTVAGWVEVYNLKAANRADAISQGRTIAQYRRVLFGSGVYGAYQAIHELETGVVGTTSGKDGTSVFAGSIVGISYPGNPDMTINNPGVGLLFRAETATGKWVNRLFRGVPDNFINNNAQQLSLGGAQPIRPGQPGFVAEGALVGSSALSNILSFTGILMEYTQYIRRTSMGPPRVYTTADFNQILFRKVAQRDTGRPFGSSRGRQF